MSKETVMIGNEKIKVMTGRDAFWETAYNISNNFVKWKQEYITKFCNIPHGNYSSIEACVESAINNGNHLAFAHYFFEKCAYEEELFSSKLKQYLSKMDPDKERKVKSGTSEAEQIKARSKWFGSNTTPVYILSENYFIDKDMTTDEMDKYQSAYGNDGKNAKGRFKTSQTIRLWREGEAIPGSKYEIVQCGIYLNLNVDQVDELLRLAGKQQLYPVNGIDFLCMAYLNIFAEEPMEKFDAESGYKRVKVLKEHVNLFLENYSKDAGEEGFRQLSKNVSKQGKEGKEGKEVKVNELGFDKKLAEIDEETKNINDINAQVQEILKSMQKALGDFSKEYDEKTLAFIRKNNMGKLTYMYFSKLKDAKSKEEIEKMIGENSAYLKQFTIKNYELHRRIYNFVKSVGFYIKNLYQLKDISLFWNENSNGLELSKLQNNVQHLNKTCEKIYEKHVYRKISENNKITDEEKKKALESIWEFEQKAGINKERSVINNLLFGREYEWKDKKKKYYQQALGSRNNLIRFCIACGREDEISRMLKLAGFRDYIETSSKEKADEKIDAFLTYLFAYRDALISRWNIKGDKMKANKYKKLFPLINLCRDINKDIQFIIEYLGGMYEWIDCAIKNHWEDLEDIQDEKADAKAMIKSNSQDKLKQEQEQKNNIDELLKQEREVKKQINEITKKKQAFQYMTKIDGVVDFDERDYNKLYEREFVSTKSRSILIYPVKPCTVVGRKYEIKEYL